MFSKSCPHCNKRLGLNERRGLLFSQVIHCIYCAKPIKIKERDGMINSIAVGAIGGILLAKYTNLALWEIAVILAVIVFALHRFVDIFFALEKANIDDYL